MDNQRKLHFTLGPVQGFIAQARRTRDLWAGSFLLSYLTGQAMYRIIEAEGKIIFPLVMEGEEITDDLLRAIASVCEKQVASEQPRVGTLPNRFQAEIAGDFDPRECAQAIQEKWDSIASRVWECFVAPVAGKGAGSQAIWQRQVENFWSINWVLGPDDNSLDRRKNWRSHVPAVEPGDKCTLMGEMQEISGYIRSKNSKKQKHFWESLRRMAGDMNIGEKERLCAISLIKRLFPLIAEEVTGWPVPTNYPSTSYIAALPWLLENLERNGQAAGEFLLEARQDDELKGRTYMEKESGILAVEKAKQRHPGIAGLAECDGNFFYEHTLANDNLWPKDTADKRRELVKRLKKFTGSPSSFYAILAVDGDRLGALLQTANDKERVSRALARFAGKVPGLVDRQQGVLIYAGGDDVLALAPLRDALALALDLRREYKLAFRNSGIDDYLATVSTGLVYAHHHAPLKAVLKETHYLLDEVAKEQTGRDSLAVRVWNTGGPGLLWTAPWERIVEGDTNIVDSLVSGLAGEDAGERQYNSAFLYNLRRRLAVLWDEDAPAELGDLDPIDLFVAEYLRNRNREHPSREQARRRMESLFKVCQGYRRVTPDKGEKPYLTPTGISMNGAILVRFLAEKGGVANE